MGRGERGNPNSTTAVARRNESDLAKQLRRQETFVATLRQRSDKRLQELPDNATLEERENMRARALKHLGSAAGMPTQKMLIRIAQSCSEIIEDADESTAEGRALAHKARQVGAEARELFMTIHSGFIRQFCSRYQHQLEGESGQEALDTLMQYARIGMNKAIDRYEFDKGANPLTYSRQWMRAEVGEGIAREGRQIRLKAKAHDLGKKVQAAAKEIQNDGRQPTAAEIAAKLKEPVSKVVDVMPYVLGPMARLDAPVSADGSDSLGSITPDDRLDVEAPLADSDAGQQIHEAVQSIKSPLRRRVIELYYGLANNEPIEQKDLFDGTYRDPKTGELFSAEPSVIRDRSKRDIDVTRKPQSELNRLFEQGKLEWQAGTPEALELALVGMPDYDPDEKMKGVITHMTGVPPTSGSIQEAKKRAEWEMAENPRLKEFRPRYRGQDELEHSLQARKEVRAALVHMGKLTPSQAERTKVGKGNAAKKGDLRLMAEKEGLVDSASGRVDRDKLAEIMAS